MYTLTLIAKDGPRLSGYEQLDVAHKMFNDLPLLPGERKHLRDARGNLLAWEARYSEKGIQYLEVDQAKEAQRKIQELAAAYNHQWSCGFDPMRKK